MADHFMRANDAFEAEMRFTPFTTAPPRPMATGDETSWYQTAFFRKLLDQGVQESVSDLRPPQTSRSRDISEWRERIKAEEYFGEERSEHLWISASDWLVFHVADWFGLDEASARTMLVSMSEWLVRDGAPSDPDRAAAILSRRTAKGLYQVAEGDPICKCVIYLQHAMFVEQWDPQKKATTDEAGLLGIYTGK